MHAAERTKAIGNDRDHAAQRWVNFVSCHKDEVDSQQAHKFSSESACGVRSLGEVSDDATAAFSTFEDESCGAQIRVDLSNVGSVGDREAGALLDGE